MKKIEIKIFHKIASSMPGLKTKLLLADMEDEPPEFIKKTFLTALYMSLGLVIVFAGLIYRVNTITLPYLFETNITAITEKLDSLDLALLQQTITDKKGSARTMGSILFVSLVYLIGVFGQILGGRLSDKLE